MRRELFVLHECCHGCNRKCRMMVGVRMTRRVLLTGLAIFAGLLVVLTISGRVRKMEQRTRSLNEIRSRLG